MSSLRNKIQSLDCRGKTKAEITAIVAGFLEVAGYRLTEIDEARPWGMFFKIENRQARKFIKEFFPEVTLSEAQMGNPSADLTPKILVAMPQMRLSWQYHHRRAELWNYITDGVLFRSLDDKPGSPRKIRAGGSAQLAPEERHRLVGAKNHPTFVAEIWQHVSTQLSDEDDIVRVNDDFSR